MSEVSLVKLTTNECQWTLLVISGTLVQVLAWCRQATSHYLSQCWPRSMLPYGITRPQWVNGTTLKISNSLQRQKLPLYIKLTISLRTGSHNRVTRKQLKFQKMNAFGWVAVYSAKLQPVCNGVTYLHLSYMHWFRFGPVAYWDIVSHRCWMNAFRTDKHCHIWSNAFGNDSLVASPGTTHM